MLNFDRVVFPTDFSPCSDQALDYATLLAEQFDAELHFLHAAVLSHDDPANPDLRFPEEIALLERLDEVTHSKLGAMVSDDLVAMLRVREATRRGFNASEVILDYASEVAADLIVMGTHGRRGPKRWFLGSVAEGVLRSARCPVLAVREREGGQKLERIDSVLVPIDFSDRSLATVRWAKELAAAYEAKVVLLHVVDIPPVPTLYGQPIMTDLRQIETRAYEELRQLADEAGLAPSAVEVAIDSGSPAAAIVDFAATHDSGMIVMSAGSGQHGVLLGGTTDRVVRRATCPVMTLPEEVVEQEQALRA